MITNKKCKEILRKYYSIIQYENIGNICNSTSGDVCLIQVNNKKYYLKKFSRKYKKNNIMIAIKIQENLSMKKLSPCIIPSIKGNVLQVKKDFYFLCEAIESVKENIDIYKIEKIATNLAIIHNELNNSINIKCDCNYLRKPFYLQTQFYLYIFYIKNFLRDTRYYVERDILLLRKFKKTIYRYKLDEKIVHGDARIDNFIITPDGSVYVIDFDQISYFPLGYDIYKLIFDLMKDKYELDKFEKIFSIVTFSYKKVNSLSDSELIDSLHFYIFTQLCDYRKYQKKYNLKNQEEYLYNKNVRNNWLVENYIRLRECVERSLSKNVSSNRKKNPK